MMKLNITCRLSSRALLDEVRANQQRIDACRGHVLQPLPGAMRYLCTQCEGVMDASTAKAYTQGQTHGAIYRARTA